MESGVLKKRLIVRVAIFSAIIGAVVFLCIYLNSLHQSKEDKLSMINNDINSLQRKLQGLSEQAIQFSEAVRVWESLPEERRAMQGLRIGEAKDLMDKFEKDYYLSNVGITFSKPEKVTENYTTSTVGVVSSSVNIKFNTISDVHAFNFLDALIKKYPGYIKVTSFSLSRNQVVTKNILKQISEQGSTLPTLVDAKLDFIWYGLEYKGPVEADSEQEGDDSL